MSNPTIPVLNDAEALALSDTVHVGSGLTIVKQGAGEGDVPSLYTRFVAMFKGLMDAIANHGQCVQLSGLNVGVFGCVYMIAGVEQLFAGSASFACDPSTTNYLWLDNAATLVKGTAWPGTAHYKIAKVQANSTAVTAILDCRQMNDGVAATPWYSIAAAADVDLDGNDLKDVGGVNFNASTQLTLDVSGAITPTQVKHKLETYTSAASDDLVAIATVSGLVGRILLIEPVNASHVVTVKSTGNIDLLDGDFVMNDLKRCIMLEQYTTTRWREVCRNYSSPQKLSETLDANSQNVLNVGRFNYVLGADLTLASDTVTITASVHKLIPEGGSGADSLATINGGADGDRLLISCPFGGCTITVVQSGNIHLSTNTDYVLTSLSRYLLLQRTGGLWYEIGRSKWDLSSLVGTGRVIPYGITCHYVGALTDNQETFRFPVRRPFTVYRADGSVKTAPSGSPCNVDIRKNGASIFGSPSAGISIAASGFVDTSDTVGVDFAPGDILSVKVLNANSAADLTVLVDAFTDAIAAS